MQKRACIKRSKTVYLRPNAGMVPSLKSEADALTW